MNSEYSDDHSFPWRHTVKALKDVVRLLQCYTCGAQQDIYQVTLCCRRHLCRKCFSERKTCSKCHCKLKVAESADVNTAFKLCNRLSALLNLHPQSNTLSLTEDHDRNNSGMDSDLQDLITNTSQDDTNQMTSTGFSNSLETNITTAKKDNNLEEISRNVCSLSMNEVAKSCSKNIRSDDLIPAHSDGKNLEQTFLGPGTKDVNIASAPCGNQNTDPDINGRVNNSKTRKRKACPKPLELIGQDDLETSVDENDVRTCLKRSGKVEGSRSSIGVDRIAEVMSPNTEKIIVANSLLMLSNEVVTKSTYTKNIIPAVTEVGTPLRAPSLKSDSSAFLTPASECRQSDKGSVRKSLSSTLRRSDQKTTSRRSRSQKSKVDSDSAFVESYFDRGPRVANDSITSETPSGNSRKSQARSESGASSRSDAKGKKEKVSKIKLNTKGESQLHLACIKGDYELAKKLLNEGMDPDVRDNANWTPLHEACNHGHPELAELLLDRGASLNILGGDNVTPLYDAAVNNSTACVELLLERGANVNTKTTDGTTVLTIPTTPGIQELLKSYTNKSSAIDANKISKTSKSVRPRKIVIVATGIDREGKDWMAKTIRELGWTLENGINEHVTHLITSSIGKVCHRTFKYMSGILFGTWIVSLDWLKACQRNRGWMDEEEYEASGCTHYPNLSIPSKARANARGRIPGIFQGCNFFITSSIPAKSETRSDLVSLIRYGSGHLLAREPKVKEQDVEMMDLNISMNQSASNRSLGDNPLATFSTSMPYHALPCSPFADCPYYLVCNSLKNSAKYQFVNKRLCRVTAAWLYDCISSLSITG